jgi:aryl sulfotransferase
MLLRTYERSRIVLLRFPAVGFILYSMAGGRIPPYFNDDIFKAEDLWGRDGDVFIVAGGKSGSTWVSNIVHEIRTKGNPSDFRDLYEEIRLPEFVYYPGQSLDERIELMKASAKGYSFAVYKTHARPPDLKVRPGARYIVVIRNFIDTAASAKTFVHSHGKEFAKMWGGFPPQAGKQFDLTEAEYTQYVLEDMGGGKGQLDIFMLDFLRAWWPLRHLNNVLFLHYSELVHARREGILRISRFLKTPLSDVELEAVVHHTAFEYMKEHASRFNLEHIHDAFKDKGLVPRNMRFIEGSLVSEGPRRNSSRELQASLIRAIRHRTERALGRRLAGWVMDGGDVPFSAELPNGLPY